MPKLTLSTMRPDQARKHYDSLILKRFDAAVDMYDAASKAPRSAKRELRRMAEAKYDKAVKFSKPHKFHREAALERKAKYGVGVAAAYLAAHGWAFNDAWNVLF